MQHDKIIIQETQTVIQQAGNYVILVASYLHQSPAQCLHSLGFDERFIIKFFLFFHVFNVFKIFLQRFFHSCNFHRPRAMHHKLCGYTSAKGHQF